MKQAFFAGSCLLAAIAAIGATLPAARADSGPPVAPVRPVTNDYFGHKVVDPYRWMEDSDSPEFKQWLAGQADYASSVLDNLPGRDKLLAQIEKLDNASTSLSMLQIAGNRYFYLKLAPGDQTPRLYRRDGLHGPERLLLNPDNLAKGGVHWAIDYSAPSWNGRYVAYGISPGGSEDDTIHILDADTGRALPESISRAQFGGVSWRPDGRSFFYNRLPRLPANAPPEAAEEKSVVYLHVLGTRPASDKAVFGYDVDSRIPLAPADTPYVSAIPGCPYLIAEIEHGVQNELTLYAAPAARLSGAATPWVKIADRSDDVTGIDAHGSTLFLLSHKGAPRYQVLALNLAHPNLAKARVLVPQSGVVVEGIGAASDALYVQDLDGGIGKLRRVPYRRGPGRMLPAAQGPVAGQAASSLRLPYAGALADMATDETRPGLLFEETSWTHSALFYSYNPATGGIANTGLKPLSPVSFAGITSVEVKARSADGALVPLSIVFKRGIKLDGAHPTLLEGYGAYGITLDPYFSPTSLPWLDRGGVLAYAHIRGGGEYGEAWHQAGMKLTKQHSIDDFIACARYLIAHGYTSPAHLAGTGASAGGIVVGGALTQHPELFGAMINEVGVSDALRSELEPNGPPNIPEFGSFTTPNGFKALYAMDAYLHVKDGVRYPAVLLTTGANDPRVSPWEPAKMAARLQAATASGKPVLLRVDYDAGHGIGSTKAQDDKLLADEDAFLSWQIGDHGPS